MVYETKMFKELLSTNTDTYNQLFLLQQNGDKFYENIKLLDENALEVYINILIMHIKSNPFLKEAPKFSIKSIFEIIEDNKSDFEGNSKILMLMLNMLALTSIIRTDGALDSFTDFLVSFQGNDMLYEYDIVKLIIIISIEKKKIRPVLEHLNADKLITNLFSNTPQIQMKSFEILSALIELQDDIINKVITNILDLSKPYTNEQKSFVLVHFIELLASKEEKSHEVIRLAGVEYIWKIVQANIESSSKLAQKQGIAFVRRVVGVLKEKEDATVTNSFFEWRPELAKDLGEFWEIYITIIECLGEVQSHLIVPSLSLLPKISGGMKVSWWNLLLKMILCHENHLVSIWGIKYVLSTTKFDRKNLEMQKIFLNSLNRTNLLSDDNGIYMSDVIDYFMKPVSGIQFLLDNAKDVNWVSVPFAVLVHVINYSLESWAYSSDTYDQILKGLFEWIDICRKMKHLTLRQLTAVGIKKAIIIILLEYYEPDFETSTMQCYLKLQELSELSNVSFAKIKDHQLVLNCIKKNGFRDLFSLVKLIKPTDNFIIKDILVPLSTANPEIQPEIMVNIGKSPIYFLYKKELWLVNNSFDEEQESLKDYFRNAFDVFESETYENDEQLSIINEILITAAAFNLDTDNFLEDPVDLLSTFAIYLNETQATTIFKGIYIIKLIAKTTNSFIQMKEFINNMDLEQFVTKLEVEEKDLKLKIVHECAEILFYTIKKNMIVDIIEKVEYCNKFVDIGDVKVLYVMIDILENVFEEHRLNLTTSFDLLTGIVERIYMEVLVYRKSEHFMKLMERFIDMLVASFSPDNEDWQFNVFKKYFELFLEQARKINGLAYLLYSKLLVLPIEELLAWADFDNILHQGLLFGDIPKKEQRVEDETSIKHYQEYYKSELFIPIISIHHDTNVRALCITFLFKLQKSVVLEAKLFNLKLNSLLIDKFSLISKTNERYYADSMIHRMKLRIVQSLSVLYMLAKYSPLLLMDVLLKETNQLNINYLLEFIIADSNIEIETIMSCLKQKGKLKTSGIQSVFILIWLRCCKMNKLPDNCINLLLPWTMAQHFSTRLYAQVTIAKLIEKFYESPKDCPFSNIYEAINSYLRQGNTEKNLVKCMEDFRFNRIKDYTDLLTLENIFINIPKLTDMATEDIMTPIMFESSAKLMKLDNLKLGNSMNSEAINKEYEEERFSGVASNSIMISQNVSENIQKKIVPIKNLQPQMELLTSLPEHLRYKKENRDEGLIVIASLVSKSPNLGGLARSCEIFAVKQYIIDSIKDIDTREFQALSMTSEKWLNIAELKSWDVVNYIKDMKSQGYSIVGAEQTTGSKPIDKIEFPKKSILILGHEKDGLPAHIISYLDIVAEIPQFGVVRSLNVHVTGAIFMWEYAKQHIFKK